MTDPRLVVVGGGVAGLAAARAARRAADRRGLSLAITLLEASPRLGGKVWTEEIGGELLEWGPDSFVARKPRGRDLAEELGLGDRLVSPGARARRAYLLLGGELREFPLGTVLGVPVGPGALLRSVRDGVLGPLGALRAACEPFLRRTRGRDLTVAEFMRRRVGSQAAERLVGPLAAGVYGSPPDALSMEAALPQFAHERSLVLAVRRMPRERGSVFLAPRDGMGALVEALRGTTAEESVLTGRPALGLARARRGFIVATPAGELAADAILLAVSAPAAATLLEPIAPEAAGLLAGVRFVSSAVVHLAYSPGSLGRRLDAAGYLCGPSERGIVAGCSWVTTKWPHLGLQRPRLRAVVNDPVALEADDAPLSERVAEEVGRVMLAGRAPEDVRLRRWDDAMPVYAPGHLERVAAARASLPSLVALAGASYDGVGVPDCVGSGEAAAEGLVGALAAA